MLIMHTQFHYNLSKNISFKSHFFKDIGHRPTNHPTNLMVINMLPFGLLWVDLKTYQLTIITECAIFDRKGPRFVNIADLLCTTTSKLQYQGKHVNEHSTDYHSICMQTHRVSHQGNTRSATVRPFQRACLKNQ